MGLERAFVCTNTIRVPVYIHDIIYNIKNNLKELSRCCVLIFVHFSTVCTNLKLRFVLLGAFGQPRPGLKKMLVVSRRVDTSTPYLRG